MGIDNFGLEELNRLEGAGKRKGPSSPELPEDGKKLSQTGESKIEDPNEND